MKSEKLQHYDRGSSTTMAALFTMDWKQITADNK